jgi:hypothetical protein
MSILIPNSFQTPNAYIDRFLHLLTAEEWKVLSYAVRRISGFDKAQDQISLSQFVGGATLKDGTIRDYGTGLSRAAVVKALAGLTTYRLLIAVQPGGHIEATTYGLQLDYAQIDQAGLEARLEAQRTTNRKRTQQATVVRTTNHPKASTSDEPPRYVAQTTTSTSDVPQVVRGTDTQYPEAIQKQSREEGANEVGATRPSISNQTSATDPATQRHKRKAAYMEHKAVQSYMQLFCLTPDVAARKIIAETVERLDCWERALAYWASHTHWNRGNVAGILDYYRRYAIEADQAEQQRQQATQAQTQAQQERERYQQRRQQERDGLRPMFSLRDGLTQALRERAGAV